ncbi:MAG: ABC transporter permease [Planctomycetaceae bacterium]|jgi:phospholipid/cholesterol/gamma-HCH transport system permease protein|nr:ABC transporter permease [Planctomycetaceae bacterium]
MSNPLPPPQNEPKNLIFGIGEICAERLISLGQFVDFCFQTFAWLSWKLPHREILSQSFYTIGVLSLPIIILTGLFIGMVLAVQTFTQFKQIGMESALGGVISLSLIRELGPVLAATMLAGRVGSSIAAELGTMRVTEQIDALATMGTSPIHHLVVPRLLACLFLIPALTIIADITGIVGGAFYCIEILDIHAHYYWENAQSFVGVFDILAGTFKSVFFGISIALISCYQGFHCSSGAEGVGKAATLSFVCSFVAILFLDLLLGITIDQVTLMFGITSGVIKGGM